MKKLLLSIFLLVVLSSIAIAQTPSFRVVDKRLFRAVPLYVVQSSTSTASRVRNGTSDPATCQPTSNNIFLNTTTDTLKICSATDTWSNVGGGGSGITVGTTTITSGTAGRVLYETAGNVVGEISGATSDGTTLTATTPIIANGLTASGSGANTFAGSTGTFLTSTGAVTIGPGAVGVTGVPTFTPPVRTSGVAPFFKITTPADTGQTADTEFPGIVFGGDASNATVIRTGADGTTIAEQREYWFVPPTYAFAGATTLTRAVSLYAASPVVGTSATFTSGIGALFEASAAAHVPLVLRGAASQSGDYLRVVSSANANLLTISSIGAMVLPPASPGAGSFTLASSGSSTSAISLKSTENSGSGHYLVLGNGAGGVQATINELNADDGADGKASKIRLRAGTLSTLNGNIAFLGSTTHWATVSDAVTSTVTNAFGLDHYSSGTPAAGFGTGILLQGKSSTTAQQNMAQVYTAWQTATHASRRSFFGIQTVSNAQTLSDRIIAGSTTTVATNNVALALFDVVLPTLKGCAGLLTYRVFVTDGTDVQIRSGIVRYSAVNKAAAYTSETAIVNEAASVSAGTLTATFSVTTGTNLITINITPNTSLTATTYYVEWTLQNLSESTVSVKQ